MQVYSSFSNVMNFERSNISIPSIYCDLEDLADLAGHPLQIQTFVKRQTLNRVISILYPK